MDKHQTEIDFERLSWHDCHIWRLDFRVGDPEDGDWTSDLVVGIDYIVEWLCALSGKTTFRIAPAMLVFHGVTDPRIDIDWGNSGFQVAMHDVCIDRIEREAISNQKIYLDRAYYRWRIFLNWPKGGEIAFGAVGFTQTLLADPIVCENQRLSLSERSQLTGL